jgi:uncharacterized protein
MPGGASKLRDVRKLADTRSTLDLDIPVAELPGLPLELITAAGQVHARLQFGREQGYMVAQVALRGQLELICQRCMRPMPLRVDTDAPVLLVESESEAENAPVEWETYLAAEGRLSPAALAAEELLLTLPIVPLHAVADCDASTGAALAAPAAGPGAASAGADDVAKARPFADLRALLDRGTKESE